MAEKNRKKESPKAKEKKAPKKKEEKREIKQENKKEKIRDKTEHKKILPPIDFSSLVLPFFTQALIELGETEDPEAKSTEENLKLTQRLIDLLDMLKQKTAGNLKPEEQIFLDQCLHQLKMAYMERAKIITL
jgi:ABC-type hemin transport system ATPase subunit